MSAAPVHAPRGPHSYEGLCWPTDEQRLLLRCLHLPAHDAREAFRAWRARADLATLDSGSLALMPLLGARLVELHVEDPMLPLSLLRGAHHRSWVSGQLLLRGAARAVDALARRGVPLLALKGLPLLDRYGGDLGLRPMSDVDLLVPRARAREALHALAADGWQLSPPLSRRELDDKLLSFHGWTLRSGRVEVDLHWASLIEDRSPDADARLWARAERLAFLGRELSRPSPADLLFHVCVHGARFSRAMSVVWVPDGMRLIGPAGGGVDWPVLVGEARARRLQVPVRETLRFLSVELGAPVPPEVLEALAPPEPAWLYWYDYHAFSADPRDSTTAHRAAAKAVALIRAGKSIAGI
jgi:hypothetical protein